jgi:hypothetical protein
MILSCFGKRCWCLQLQVTVEAVKGKAHPLAFQPDPAAIYVGIQERKDMLQGNVWESREESLMRRVCMVSWSP